MKRDLYRQVQGPEVTQSDRSTLVFDTDSKRLYVGRELVHLETNARGTVDYQTTTMDVADYLKQRWSNGRAATVRNILDFPEQFGRKAEIITLDRNYRSTQPILTATNGIIDLAKERFTKNLWTERTSSTKPRLLAVRDETDQANYIVERILEDREEGALLKQQAVLFRTSSHSGPLEIELTRRNIPFVKFGGLRFLDVALRKLFQTHDGLL